VTSKHLHIVALDVPYPANYGGAIEMFHKIKWLHHFGYKIQLHCFTSKRPPQDILDQFCEEVFYYHRQPLARIKEYYLPYIVRSRSNKTLLENLQKDDHPILLEGIHCTYFLHIGALSNRKVFVRLHNTEFNYYEKLSQNEPDVFKKMYYRIESKLLKRYERKLAQKAIFLAMSKTDEAIYKNKLKAKDVRFLPPFVGWEKVAEPVGKGSFCLYHGNLAVNENEKAASWLLTDVFNDINIPLVIAGSNPSEELEKLAHVNNNTCLVSNPSEKEMQDLIGKAQVNILPSFNNTGIKLKIINALYTGRHCLVNPAAQDGASIAEVCHVAADASAFKEKAAELYEEIYNADDIARRQDVLNNRYCNEKTAIQLISWLH
jgi:glycosyltransferase involved in cell wall biosynthesis